MNGPAKLLYEVTGQNRASSWSFSGKRRVISFTGSNALRCQSSLQPIRLAQRHSKGHNIRQQGRSPVIHAISFAQFEREVTGERIRDKIAASKRKGLWMGGPVPLGYDVENRKLLVNETEADLVRHIMRRYLELDSVAELADDINRAGHRTKVQHRASGPHRGGCIFRRGTLYHLLSNRIYLGELKHKQEHFRGEHEAIVTPDLWEAVQVKLKTSAQGTSRRIRARQPSLLAGLLVDGEGRAMTPSHATKSGRRYRYYVTRPDQLDGTPAWRLSAHDLEHLVCGRLAALLADGRCLHDLVGNGSAEILSRTIAHADTKAATLHSGTPLEKIGILAAIIDRISLREDRIDLVVDPARLCAALDIAAEPIAEEPLSLSLPVVKVRRGHQLRLIIPGPEIVTPAKRDEKLVALVAEAHAARRLMLANAGKSLSAIAAAHGKCRTRLGKLIALSCMAPDIVTAIVEGRQPASLTARGLLKTDLPLAWDGQRLMLGFA